MTSEAVSVKYYLTMDAALIPPLHDALVVSQTGSVGEAARRLHKTASAVSPQLRRIEQHFGRGADGPAHDDGGGGVEGGVHVRFLFVGDAGLTGGFGFCRMSR